MGVHADNVHVRTQWPGDCSLIDEQILETLRVFGAQTIEQLVSSFTGASWAQVFLAIDRLSRSGQVSLRPTGGREYRVSLNVVSLTWAS